MGKRDKVVTKGNKKNKKIVSSQSFSTDSSYPVWIFTDVDKSGKFAFNVNRDDFDHKGFLDKMIQYSTMSWAEIKQQTHDKGKSKHHYLTYESLSKETQDRIIAKHMEESTDQIFSFAFNNLLRIVGIRDKEKFYVLWYDPKHEICPSKLK